LAQLASRVEATASQISKLERGQTRLNVEWMNRLGAALGCRPVELLFDAPPPPSHINAELLRQSIYVADAVCGGEPATSRASVMVDIIAAVYDVLVDTLAEGIPIDDSTLRTLIFTHRRNLATAKSDG
jgi:hypothetical protein